MPSQQWWIENEPKMRELADAGYAGSQIAAVLTTDAREFVSRNAVIGQCSRRGIQLKGVGGIASKVKAPRVPRHKSERKRKEPAVVSAGPAKNRLPPVELVDPEAWWKVAVACVLVDTAAGHVEISKGKIIRYGAAKAHDELQANSCRWPAGDPKEDDFRFCMEPTASFPYCQAHAKRGIDPRRPSRLR